MIELNLASTISVEQVQLQALRGFYDYGVTTKQTVDKYSFVQVGGNYYSVPVKLSLLIPFKKVKNSIPLTFVTI
ncbi:hypothetical protein [Enterococcus rivorum]|uniref:hypothetical protein n=1 Tax=Enterococcus rivorum TaxID=762845 RepID=UPI001FD8E61B|nr:hypothetical protein [Enterococcus rivorum]MBP2100500.1 hypothetical protein [Enterococcus rivorum]